MAARGRTEAPGEVDDAISNDRVNQIIEEYESESRTERRTGFWGLLAWVLAAAISIYALYWTQYSVTTHVYRATFLLLVLVLSFVLYAIHGRRSLIEFLVTVGIGVGLFGVYWPTAPAAAKARFFEDLTQPAVLGGIIITLAGLALYAYRTRRDSRAVPAYDVALCLASIVSLTFLVMNYESALQRIVNPTAMEVSMGILLVVVILEATRRTAGWALPLTGVLFLLYGFLGPYVPEPFDHRGYAVPRIIGQNFLTLEGIFGVPLDVAATFIVLFTIYGAVLEYSGAGKFFIDWSFAALGNSRSGSGPGRTTVADRIPPGDGLR